MDQLHLVCPKFEQILDISLHLWANKHLGKRKLSEFNFSQWKRKFSIVMVTFEDFVKLGPQLK